MARSSTSSDPRHSAADRFGIGRFSFAAPAYHHVSSLNCWGRAVCEKQQALAQCATAVAALQVPKLDQDATSSPQCLHLLDLAAKAASSCAPQGAADSTAWSCACIRLSGSGMPGVPLIELISSGCMSREDAKQPLQQAARLPPACKSRKVVSQQARSSLNALLQPRAMALAALSSSTQLSPVPRLPIRALRQYRAVMGSGSARGVSAADYQNCDVGVLCISLALDSPIWPDHNPAMVRQVVQCINLSVCLWSLDGLKPFVLPCTLEKLRLQQQHAGLLQANDPIDALLKAPAGRAPLFLPVSSPTKGKVPTTHPLVRSTHPDHKAASDCTLHTACTYALCFDIGRAFNISTTDAAGKRPGAAACATACRPASQPHAAGAEGVRAPAPSGGSTRAANSTHGGTSNSTGSTSTIIQ